MSAHRHVVYHSPEAPEEMSFIAYTLVPGSKKGTEHRIHVAFPASTAEAALSAAAASWQAEVDRELNRQEAARKRGEALDAKRAERTKAAQP